MKLLTFAASNSATSINKQLATYAASIVKNEIGDTLEVEVIDLNDYAMPIYSAQSEVSDGIPRQALDFYEKIASADAVMISFAEHNGNYTAAYKNIVDWTSRHQMPLYQGKTAFLLSTSPGKAGASSVMQIASGNAPFFGLEVKGSLSVPSFNDNFDKARGVISNDELDSSLREALTEFIAALSIDP